MVEIRFFMKGLVDGRSREERPPGRSLSPGPVGPFEERQPERGISIIIYRIKAIVNGRSARKMIRRQTGIFRAPFGQLLALRVDRCSNERQRWQFVSKAVHEQR